MENVMETPMESSEVAPRPGRGQAPGSKRTQFRSGDEHPKRRPPSPESAEAGEGVVSVDLLSDARWVYSRSLSEDKTPGQKAMRALLKKNPERFFAQMMRLEEEARAGHGQAQSVPLVSSEGTVLGGQVGPTNSGVSGPVVDAEVRVGEVCPCCGEVRGLPRVVDTGSAEALRLIDEILGRGV